MTSSEQRLRDVAAAVVPLDPAVKGAARHRQAQLTKPAGALGVLEDASALLARPLARAAGAVLREMATFGSAGVTHKDAA